MANVTGACGDDVYAYGVYACGHVTGACGDDVYAHGVYAYGDVTGACGDDEGEHERRPDACVPGGGKVRVRVRVRVGVRATTRRLRTWGREGQGQG